MSRTYHQRARILVVDNSEINREMLNDILGETYEIRLAGSGREALEILEKEHWNLELVLLKLEMPDIDGYELLEIMRHHRHHPWNLHRRILTAMSFWRS